MKPIIQFLNLLTIMMVLPGLPTARTEQPITTENVVQLDVVQRLGEGLIYGARWTQSGNLFVECASTGLWLYDGHDVEKAPHLLNGSTRCLNFDMNADGTLFVWTADDVDNSWEND